MTDIFSSDISEAVNVKNLLENAGIRVFLVNEHMSSIEPGLVAASGFDAATLRIDDADVAKASAVIDQYRNGF
ncbi:hypothetical protein FLLO111716_09285 [Flavobacterium longum]|uniref:putative signal transducing protein n=1 Tax=Flavobacterium longum TaxID=1299340 RepID=UPI0039EBC62C